MSNLSNFTGKFRAHGNYESGTKVTKRPRPSTVCSQCRRYKLRCDRSLPCSSCVRRDQEALCSYELASISTNESNRNAVTEQRLLHLETMVKQLIENQVPAKPDKNIVPASLTPPDVATDPDMISGQPQPEQSSHSEYAGSTHWSSILDDIHELKIALGDFSNTASTDIDSATEKADLDSEPIYGFPSRYSLQQIIDRYLPPKFELDRLLALYFRGRTFITPFIHTHHFQRQYEGFWDDPPKCNPLWLSLLFSACFLGSLVEGPTAQDHSRENTSASDNAVLRIAAGHCLVIGGFYRPQQFGPEALAMYAHCKNMKTLDPSREAAAVLGMAIRMAYEMGYHRDPDSYGSFSVFEGEMRRRFWATNKQMDLMMSFMLGLPSNINVEASDTRSPSNLLDSDFDADTEVLPPSRSEEEPTKMLWFIVKDKQMPYFNRVCQDALSFKDKSDQEIIQLDQEIKQMHKTTPDILRIRPLAQCIAEDPFLIVTRIYIEMIYLKSLCVLHRRHMARGSIFSTSSCVEAGKEIVSLFVAMYRELSPGGLLHTERWMLSTFTMNDFLLGVMVLCLAIHIRTKKGSNASAMDDAAESEARDLLEQSHIILIEKSPVSRDARRVSIAVRLTLNGVDRTTAGPASISSPQHSLQEPSQREEMAFGSLDPFNFMADDFDDFDWAVADPDILYQGP